VILFQIPSTRYGDLNKHNLSNPLRVFRQENVHGVEFLWYALDIVKAINPNDYLYTCESSTQSCHAGNHFRRFETFAKLLRVDPYREGIDSYCMVLESN
jgi:hypothetical protein